MRDTTSILQDGFMGNLTTLRELRRCTVRHWRTDRVPNPARPDIIY